MLGKLPPELLEALVVGRTGASDPRVLQGPAYGEDTAAIQLPESVLVVNSDPLSLAVERLGTLGVTVAANDVAASGATPEWLTSVLFLPGEDEAVLDELTRQLDAQASALDVAIVGGHSEYTPALKRPMLVATCFGLADRYIPTGGARPGDRVVLTKGAAIEATAILATDFRDSLSVPESVFESAETFFDDISVVADAAVVAEYASAMHDPTEGGLIDGLLELAVASGVALDIDIEAIPIRTETEALCAAAGVDPLRTFGSGALLATVPPEATTAVTDGLAEQGITSAVIGTVHETDDPAVDLDGERYTEAIRDDMYALWE